MSRNTGILIGLILVIIQINQNSELLRLQLINDEFSTMTASETLIVGENPAEALMKAMYSPQDMTYADFRVNDAYIVGKIDLMYRRYRLAQEGVFGEAYWQDANIGFTFEWVLGSQFGKLWWEHAGRDTYADAPEFVEYIDSKVRGVTENRSTRAWEAIRSELQAE